MKSILSILMLFSINSFASSKVNFKCELSDITYINQFALEVNGLVVEDGKFHNTEFDFTLRKAGKDTQLERYTTTRDGSLKVYPAGTIYKHEISHIASAVKGAELEYISLQLNVGQLKASFIRFLDGATYFGTCKTL